MYYPELIYLVRHGQTEYNRLRIVQGRGVNSSLNEQGFKQAAALYAHYKQQSFDAIYASSQLRSQQTVAPFTQQGYTINKFSNLDEMSWGNHEGRASTPESREEYKALTQSWHNGDYRAAIKHGESAYDVQQRLKHFLHTHLYQQKHHKVLLCTHGRTSCILVCMLLQQTLKHMPLYRHKNTGVSILQHTANGQYTLTQQNNTEHLSEKNGYMFPL